MPTPQRTPLPQRGAAAAATLRVAEQLEEEAQHFKNRHKKPEPVRESPASISTMPRRYLWQYMIPKRDPLPPDNLVWKKEVPNLDEYYKNTRNLEKGVLREGVRDDRDRIIQVINMLMETGNHYNWLHAKNAPENKIAEIGKELYWKTGVLVNSDEVLGVWRNGRAWIRTSLKKWILAGKNEQEIETEFRKNPRYPYLRFARACFVDYEREIRKQYSGEEADEALIKQREDEDDIKFEGIYRSEHQMTLTLTNVKAEWRNIGRQNESDFDSDPAPPPETSSTSDTRRRSAPSDASSDAPPAKIRANAPNPFQTPPQSSQPFRAPAAPVRGYPQEGFSSGFSSSTGSESPRSVTSPPLNREMKPVPFHALSDVMEQEAQWAPIVNPLNPNGVYSDGRTQSQAVEETCKIVVDRLMLLWSETSHKKPFLDMIRTMADTVEQEGKMEVPEVFHECMIKHRIAQRNPKK